MNQDPTQGGGPAPGNRPPPPPPRKPVSGGQGQAQGQGGATPPPPSMPSAPPQPQQPGGVYAPAPQPQYPAQPPPPPGYPAQTPNTGFPQGAPPPPGQYDPYAQQQGQFYPQQGQYYGAPRRGLPLAAWLGIGGGLLALIIASIVVILLVTNKGSGGGGGGGNTPADTIRDYYARLANHDYNGALSLYIPQIAAQVSADQLKQSTENVEQQHGGSTFGQIDIANATEQGDTASATATAHTKNGDTVSTIQYTLQKVNGKWLIAGAQ